MTNLATTHLFPFSSMARALRWSYLRANEVKNMPGRALTPDDQALSLYHNRFP